VADIKYNHILNITKQAEKCENINRIMLFGSSLEERCSARSDIDIAVFGKKPKGRYIDSKEFRSFKRGLFEFDWDQDYDVLYFSDNGKNSGDIMADINRGIEIYRRTAE
jgi:predicted nucleotidyltransferase